MQRKGEEESESCEASTKGRRFTSDPPDRVRPTDPPDRVRPSRPRPPVKVLESENENDTDSDNGNEIKTLRTPWERGGDGGREGGIQGVNLLPAAGFGLAAGPIPRYMGVFCRQLSVSVVSCQCLPPLGPFPAFLASCQC